MLETIGWHCVVCQRQTLHGREKTSCLVHAVLIVLTAGLAIPFLVILALVESQRDWTCQTCGHTP